MGYPYTLLNFVPCFSDNAVIIIRLDIHSVVIDDGTFHSVSHFVFQLRSKSVSHEDKTVAAK